MAARKRAPVLHTPAPPPPQQHALAGLGELLSRELDRDAVRERMQSGRYSLLDMLVAKAYAGNERLLVELFREAMRSTQEEQEAAAAQVAQAVWQKATEDD